MSYFRRKYYKCVSFIHHKIEKSNKIGNNDKNITFYNILLHLLQLVYNNSSFFPCSLHMIKQ